LVGISASATVDDGEEVVGGASLRRVERGRMTGGGRTKEDGVKKRAKRVRRVRRDDMGIINTQAGYYLGSRGWRKRQRKYGYILHN